MTSVGFTARVIVMSGLHRQLVSLSESINCPVCTQRRCLIVGCTDHVGSLESLKAKLGRAWLVLGWETPSDCQLSFFFFYIYIKKVIHVLFLKFRVGIRVNSLFTAEDPLTHEVTASVKVGAHWEGWVSEWEQRWPSVPFESIKCQSLLNRAAYGQITLTTKLSRVSSGHFGCENWNTRCYKLLCFFLKATHNFFLKFSASLELIL